jgi:cysteinyl-tRNA synthetase
MSKSLKNTVSIKELLQTYKPDELRLFCLLSSYRYDKEFTHENMTKPQKLLSTFRSFIEHTNAYSNGLLNKTIKLSDVEILERLDNSISAIDDSFKDDFNTNAVINELISLISFINRDIIDGRELNTLSTNFGAVAAVKQFVEDTLDTLGVTSVRDATEIADSVSLFKLIKLN